MNDDIAIIAPTSTATTRQTEPEVVALAKIAGRERADLPPDGIPVPRSQVRPGDLVFPSTGHVQMAIGNNLVVEAPHAGATVRISPLGTGVQIRRPVG